MFDSSTPELSAIIARLFVLFEDLRIEEAASRMPALPDLDVIGASYRKIYFVRRGIATLVEFGGALKMLDEQPDFQQIRRGFKNGGPERWRDAVEFFVKQKPYLSKVRADFGGHFDHASALHAVTDMHPETRGVLEIVKNYAERTGGVRLKYAMDIVGTAMTRRRPVDQTSDKYFNEMFTVVRTGFRHAVEAMHTVAAFHVLPRFGRPTR